MDITRRMSVRAISLCCRTMSYIFPYVIKSVTGSCGKSMFIFIFCVHKTTQRDSHLRVEAFMAANIALAASAADDAGGGINVREASVGVM